MLHHDIVINSDNIPIFLINEKSQDNLLTNVLKNIDINEEIPMMVEKNDLAKRWGVESAIHSISHNTSILILSEKSNDTQGSCSIKVRKNLEIADIASKLTSTIADPIEFRIEGSICDNNDRNDDRTSSESIESNAENSLDAYRCSANEAVLVNTSRENEFISIGPSANVKPEYLTNYIFCEEVNHPHLFANGKCLFQTKRKVQLSPSKYSNQQLLNYMLNCSSDSDCIFFAHSIMQRINLSNQINFARERLSQIIWQLVCLVVTCMKK